MCRNRILLQNALLCSCLLVCSDSRAENSVAWPGQVVVAADLWCPYSCRPGSSFPGYALELLEQIYSAYGIGIVHKVMPSGRAVLLTEIGKADAVLAMAGDTGVNLVARESLASDDTVLVVRKGEGFLYRDGDNLQDKYIGVIANHSYDRNGNFDALIRERQRMQDRIHVSHHEKPVSLLYSMLIQHRIDLFPESRHVAAYNAKLLSRESQVEFIETGMQEDIFMAFAPDARGKRLLEIFDREFFAMKSSGRLSHIKLKYELADSDHTDQISHPHPAD